jgi:hypothetical protein
VRSPSRSASLTATYPAIKVVSGTLDDFQILSEEAAKADIVFHFASSDHVSAAEAIKAGLQKGDGEMKYWIHTSGTDILLSPKILEGQEVENDVEKVKVYDDWDGIKELVSFNGSFNHPICIHSTNAVTDSRSHRPCDKVVLSANSEKVKTAIICPPTIFGPGKGTGSTRSHQVYELAMLTLERGRCILVPGHGEGKPKTFWPNIHVNDLARLYEHVVDSAVTELEGGEGKASWGDEGYYFAENGVHYVRSCSLLLLLESECRLQYANLSSGRMSQARSPKRRKTNHCCPWAPQRQLSSARVNGTC